MVTLTYLASVMLKFCDRSAARLTVGEEPWTVVFRLKYSGRGGCRVNWSPKLKFTLADPKPVLYGWEMCMRGRKRSFCPPKVGGAGRMAAKGEDVSIIVVGCGRRCGASCMVVSLSSTGKDVS